MHSYLFFHLVPDIHVILIDLSSPLGFFGNVVISLFPDGIVVASHEFLVFAGHFRDLRLVMVMS